MLEQKKAGGRGKLRVRPPVRRSGFRFRVSGFIALVIALALVIGLQVSIFYQDLTC